MRIPKLPLAIAGLSMAAVLTVGWQVHAEATRATFPELDNLVHYTTVKRGNVTEHIMTTPAAIDAVRWSAGQRGFRCCSIAGIDALISVLAPACVRSSSHATNAAG